MATGLGDEQLWLCPTLDNATPFNDLSSQGNNGTAQGGLSTVADTGSGGAYAYDLDGTDDYIDVTSSGVPASAYTVSLWQYSTNSGINTAFNAGQVGGERSVNIDGVRAGLSGDNHGHRRGSTSYWASNPTVRTSATWYHYLLTYDGSQLRLYVDGVYVANRTGVPNTDWIENRCWVGQYIGGSYFFQGRIDDIRTYDRPLTPSEITHLATARGIEGRPFDGLGDEQLWLCPSLENSPNDLSGNNNNGVYQGGMGTVADTSNGGSLAYDFDGTGDYISNSSLDLRNLPAMSWSAWVKDDKTSGLSSFFSHGLNGQFTNDTYFFQSAGNNRFQVNQSGDGTGSATSPTSSTWNHLAVVFDGSGAADSNRLRYFANGVEVALSYDYTVPATTGNPSSSSTRIGDYVSAAGSNLFLGRQDDIRVYNRALTQSEISWLATERGVLGTPPEGLGDEQLWLCPSIQDSANDISINNNHGTLVGGTAIVSDTGSGGTKSFESYTTATDRVDIPSGVLSDSSDVSLSVWVKNKQTSAGSSVRNIVRTTNDDLFIYANQTRYRGGAGGVYVQDTLANLNTTEYYHYALNYTQATGTVELFRNGVSIGTTSGATAITVSGAMDLLKTSVAFVDDIRAYNRVLTQAEISWLATERGVLGTPPEGLGDEQLWLCPSIQDSANDISGNGNNGTYVGGMGTVASDGKLCYDFDGTNDYINCGTGFNPAANLSLSAWINADTWSGDPSGLRTIIEKGFDGTNEKFSFVSRSNGSSLDLYTYITPDEHGIEGQVAPPSVASWHHVCGTFDGSTWKLFFNGVQVATDADSTALPSSTQEVSIGASEINGSPERYFSGKMDDIRTYDRALTQAEITHLASQRGVLGSPTATTQYNAFLTHAFRQLFQTRLR